MTVSLIISLLFPLSLAAAMINDLARFEIPNTLPLLLVAGYLPAALLAGLPAAQIGWSAAIAFGLLLAGFVLFLLQLLGGGDAKLIAAAALWTGSEQTPEFLLYTALFGGVVALGLMLLQRLPVPASLGRNGLVARLRRSGRVPYALAIGPAGLLLFPALPVVQAAAP